MTGLTFDITSDTEIADSSLVKVVKLSYSMGCLTVLIAECENNLQICSARPEPEFRKVIERDLVRLQQYKSQKQTIEILLAKEIADFYYA